MTIRDHCHLFADTGTEPQASGHDNTSYHLVMPGYDDRPVAAVQAERGLTGVLMVHRLEASAGVPVKFKDFGAVVLATTAEKARLDALNGMNCYFMPFEHGETGFSAPYTGVGGWKCLMTIENAKQLDPHQDYWMIQIKSMDNTVT